MIKQRNIKLSDKRYLEGIKKFMYTIDIYKKIFSLLILIGLILCDGMCVYAHSNELMKAIDTSSKKPTVENLGRLVHLLEEDVIYHESRGETIEAKKSKAMAASIRVAIVVELRGDEIEENPEELIDLMESAFDLWEDVRQAEGSKDDLMSIKYFMSTLGSIRIKNALLEVNRNPTIENYKRMICLLEDDIKRLESRGKNVEAKRLKAMVALSKLTVAMEGNSNPTEKNFKKIIRLTKLVYYLWNDVRVTEEAEENLKSIKNYKAELGTLRIRNEILKVDKNPTEESCKEIINLLKLQANLCNDAGDNEKAKESLMFVRYFEVKLRSLKTKNMLLKVQENPTRRNLERLISLLENNIQYYI